MKLLMQRSNNYDDNREIEMINLKDLIGKKIEILAFNSFVGKYGITTILQHREILGSQNEMGEIKNCFVSNKAQQALIQNTVLTAKPNKPIYCYVESVEMVNAAGQKYSVIRVL